ncbi:MAG: type II CRISPR-associated endonuclease Cas1 [Gammaproteobacteria bacterium]|nr:type II CRISPR-associated endonuclease Cas1 [Gammaproteobacteria bacterium]
MTWRIIDIAESGRYLHSERKSLVVLDQKKELGRIPLRDIQSILVHSYFGTYSHELLVNLAEYNIPLVICDKKHLPIALLTPVSNHHLQAGRVQAQASTSKPVRKRIWKCLVKAKIREQSRTLKPIDFKASKYLNNLEKKVRSGDLQNIEAQAARFYWKKLFGESFHRDRHLPGINSHLNYGYIILRSALARAVISAGLTPSLGVGHVNSRNNFCLVDDLIEPFRPLVDRIVWQNQRDWKGEISNSSKEQLAGIMEKNIMLDSGETDLFRTMTIVVSSLVSVFEKSKDNLELPSEIKFVNFS